MQARLENGAFRSILRRVDIDAHKLDYCIILPTFRSYFWELASEAGLHCRDNRNLSFIKPLRKPSAIQTAECGKEKRTFPLPKKGHETH